MAWNEYSSSCLDQLKFTQMFFKERDWKACLFI